MKEIYTQQQYGVMCEIFFFSVCVAVCTDCDVFVLFSPLPVFSISSISLPASSLTLTVFLCCYLSTAHQASPAGYAAEPLPHRTKQPGIHWYAAHRGPWSTCQPHKSELVGYKPQII